MSVDDVIHDVVTFIEDEGLADNTYFMCVPDIALSNFGSGSIAHGNELTNSTLNGETSPRGRLFVPKSLRRGYDASIDGKRCQVLLVFHLQLCNVMFAVDPHTCDRRVARTWV
jgi:hypothetical protein